MSLELIDIILTENPYKFIWQNLLEYQILPEIYRVVLNVLTMRFFLFIRRRATFTGKIVSPCFLLYLRNLLADSSLKNDF